MNDKIKLLYIDDEPINVYVFMINFGKKYNLLTARSGQEGLKILRSNPEIKIIITDYSMPGMDGLEFVREAKSQFPDCSFFILTGYELSDDIRYEIDRRYIKEYFSKPLNIKKLAESIEGEICNLTF